MIRSTIPTRGHELAVVAAALLIAASSSNARPAQKGKGPAAATPQLVQGDASETTGLGRYERNTDERVFALLRRASDQAGPVPDSYTSTQDRQAWAQRVGQKLAEVGPVVVAVQCESSAKEYLPDEQMMAVKWGGWRISRSEWDSQLPQEWEGSAERWNIGPWYVDKSSSFIGRNAMGATVEVEKSVLSPYGLIVREILPRNDDGSSPNQLVAKFPMKSEQARTADKTIRCLGVFQPVGPGVIKYEVRQYPTLSWPYDKTLNWTVVTAEVMSLIVYDARTGNLLARVNRR